MSSDAAAGRRLPLPARSRRSAPVASITSAPEALSDDQARRLRRYLLQMGFRVVCFLGAYVASGWLRWSLVVCAVVIPYIAVILVNAGRDRVRYDTSAVTPAAQRELPAAPLGPGSDDARTVVVDPEARGDPRVVRTEMDLPGSADPVAEGDLICSAKGCRAEALWGLLWNNPKLHTPERRKVWLACDTHRPTLEHFLGRRDFWKQTVPVTDLERTAAPA